MPTDTQVSNLAVDVQADALARLLDDGFLYIMDGTKPATCDTAITTQTVLAMLKFSNPSAPAAALGVLAFSVIPNTAVTTGTASWYRCYKADATTSIMDGNINTTDGNLVMSTVDILSGILINVDSFQHTVRKIDQ